MRLHFFCLFLYVYVWHFSIAASYIKHVSLMPLIDVKLNGRDGGEKLLFVLLTTRLPDWKIFRKAKRISEMTYALPPCSILNRPRSDAC
jgi:hypothetical protein